MENETKACPYCKETIKLEAIKCKHCGEILDNGFTPLTPTYQTPRQPKWSAGVAALLSFLIPGAGQMYKNQVGEGLLWLVGTIFGYFLFVLPGLIIHLICIFSAASGDPYED